MLKRPYNIDFERSWGAQLAWISCKRLQDEHLRLSWTQLTNCACDRVRLFQGSVDISTYNLCIVFIFGNRRRNLGWKCDERYLKASKHTTLFRRCNNVYVVQATLYPTGKKHIKQVGEKKQFDKNKFKENVFFNWFFDEVLHIA